MSNKFDKVVKLFLFITPVCYLTNFPLIKFDVILFQVAVTVLFVAYLLELKKRELKFGYLIPAFMGIGVFNILVHNFDIMVVNKTLNALLFIFALYMITSACKKPKECYKFMGYALMVNLVILLLQKTGYFPMAIETEAGGLMGNAPRLMVYASVIFLTLPIWLMVLVVATGIWVKEICFFIPLAIYLFIRMRKRWFALIAVVSVLVFFKEIRQAISIRLLAWKTAIAHMSAQPVAGLGWGAYMRAHPEIAIYRDTATMSSMIEYITGVGILGIVWLFYAVKNFVKCFKLDKEDLIMLSILLLCIIEYPLDIPRLWFTLAALISFYLIKRNNIRFLR